MLKVKVIVVGSCKEPWLKVALAEYEKRLLGECSIHWVEAKDDARLLQLLGNEKHYVALSPQGELLDSVSCSQKIMKLFEKGGAKISFVIGGPEGLSDVILQGALWQWSLSSLTFTHQIVRLVLLEQIYRSLQIFKGSPYHK